MGRFQTYPSSTTAGLSDRYKNNSSKKEERKKYLARNKRTRLFRKELGNLMNDRDHSRKVKDNSEDKIRSITSDFKNRRLQILQDPMNSVPRKAK